jgi:cell division transport system permease protein
VGHALREALAAFRRTPLLTSLSIAMIALSLFVVGLFGVVAHNIRVALEEIEARVEVVAYLHDDAGLPAMQLARGEISSFPEVRQVFIVTREQALERARREMPELEGLFMDRAANPLPASLEVGLRPGHRDPATVSDVADRIAAFPFVEEVRYGREWLEKVYLLRRVAGAAALVLGVGFAAIASLIIGAAVRLAVFARREEIAIMRLVGATDHFIRMPFLLEGLMAGLLGGVLALAFTFGMYRLLTGRVFELAWIPDSWILLGIAAGAFLGVLASMVSVRRHLGSV